ncbi:MAG TPA: PQQ-binding-like beta-propeller repeat protein [Armatimonadota bacterium]|jgi:outer membrane protein assembly factor BamB
MKKPRISKSVLISTGLPVLVALLGGGVLAWWLHGSEVRNLQAREPAPQVEQATPAAGTAAAPGAAATTAAGAAGSTVQSGGVAANLPGSWPNFRGPNLDNISPEQTPLARSWGASGPKVVWSVNLGEGYAGPAVLKGRVYVLDYDQASSSDVLRCLSLADGKEIWKYAYSSPVKRNHGMSRTTPAVTDKYVVTLGPRAIVVCADADTGKVYWTHDLVKEYGTKVPEWYAGQNPLIDGGKAIIAPAGKSLMVAFDLATGKAVWQTPNPRGWQMTHASLAPFTVGGKRMYAYPASLGVVGVSASDGALLWETTDWKVSTATVPTPLPVGDGKLFLTGGYNSGALMLQISGSGSKYTAKTLFRLPASVCSSAQHTPILYKGNIYAVIDGGGELVCLDLSGKSLWRSGNTHRFGLGAYLIAGGRLYLVNDSGTLTLAEASSSGYQQLAQAKVLNGPDAWGPMAMAGGLLLVRDLNRMVCLDVR